MIIHAKINIDENRVWRSRYNQTVCPTDMTVAQLIEILKEYPQDAQIFFPDGEETSKIIHICLCDNNEILFQ